MTKDPVKSKDRDPIRERSFGAAPPVMKIQGGTMPTFGHQTHEDKVWPTATDSSSQKTGYPEGFQNKKANVVPKG